MTSQQWAMDDGPIEEPEVVEQSPSGASVRLRRILGRAGQAAVAFLSAVGRPALISTLGLLLVWFVGRVMEIINGHTVFDPALTFWFALVVFVLIGLWVVGSTAAAATNLRRARRPRAAALCWVFVLVLLVLCVLSFEGFRVSARGLFAATGDAADFSQLTIFLLLKNHAFNPLLAVNLAAAFIRDVAWDLESLAPFVWSWNTLFIFFIWSLAYGIALALQKHLRGPKSVHLFLAAFGLLGLIIVKSVTTPTVRLLLCVQAVVPLMLVFQVLLAYAMLRTVAAGPLVTGRTSDDAFRVRTADKPQPAGPRFFGLPPTALALALALFIVVPVLSDLRNQFATSSATERSARALFSDGNQAGPGMVSAASLSIRSGPATGDDLVGVLPKGAQVRVLDRKNDWVKIGDNQWVREKFLRPPAKQ